MSDEYGPSLITDLGSELSVMSDEYRPLYEAEVSTLITNHSSLIQKLCKNICWLFISLLYIAKKLQGII